MVGTFVLIAKSESFCRFGTCTQYEGVWAIVAAGLSIIGGDISLSVSDGDILGTKGVFARNTLLAALALAGPVLIGDASATFVIGRSVTLGVIGISFSGLNFSGITLGLGAGINILIGGSIPLGVRAIN